LSSGRRRVIRGSRSIAELNALGIPEECRELLVLPVRVGFQRENGKWVYYDFEVDLATIKTLDEAAEEILDAIVLEWCEKMNVKLSSKAAQRYRDALEPYIIPEARSALADAVIRLYEAFVKKCEETESPEKLAEEAWERAFEEKLEEWHE